MDNYKPVNAPKLLVKLNKMFNENMIFRIFEYNGQKWYAKKGNSFAVAFTEEEICRELNICGKENNQYPDLPKMDLIGSMNRNPTSLFKQDQFANLDLKETLKLFEKGEVPTNVEFGIMQTINQYNKAFDTLYKKRLEEIMDAAERYYDKTIRSIISSEDMEAFSDAQIQIFTDYLKGLSSKISDDFFVEFTNAIGCEIIAYNEMANDSVRALPLLLNAVGNQETLKRRTHNIAEHFEIFQNVLLEDKLVDELGEYVEALITCYINSKANEYSNETIEKDELLNSFLITEEREIQYFLQIIAGHFINAIDEAINWELFYADYDKQEKTIKNKNRIEDLEKEISESRTEISRLKKIKEEKETINRELQKALKNEQKLSHEADELKKEIQKLKQTVGRLESENGLFLGLSDAEEVKKEIERLRTENAAYEEHEKSMMEEAELYWEFDQEEIQRDLYEHLFSKRIIFVGGHLRTLDKLKELFPNSRFVDTMRNDKLNLSAKDVRSYECVVYFTRFLSHTDFQKVRSVYMGKQKTQEIMINQTGLNAALNTISNQLSCQSALTKERKK